MKPLGTLLIAVSFFSVSFFLGGYGQKKVAVKESSDSMQASVFFAESTSATHLRDVFNSATSTKRKLKILIVPGHESDYGGAEYLNIKERDLNADLGLVLAQYLVQDGHYDVLITRGREEWSPALAEYFANHADEIKTFILSQKAEMAKLVEEGKMSTMSNALPHNSAPSDVALRLFGINKWANDHKVDIVIHIHFNDSSPRRNGVPGEYNGFTIYTPEHQYSNAEASHAVAESVFNRLSKMFPVSSLPGEDRGLVEDQDLIAIGNSNTVDAASILIEYGYIYEPQLQTTEVREHILKELAFQTYLGLTDFFGETPLVVGPYQSTLLPYSGKTEVRKTAHSNSKVLSLQAALLDKGFYPPENYTKNDCPLSGVFGKCTRSAVTSFQKEFEIKGEDGVVGAKTRSQLRSLFQPTLMSVEISPFKSLTTKKRAP